MTASIMDSNLFDYPPTVEILKQLVQGNLKQNLSKALRLWVILQSLYGDEALELEDSFTYQEWGEKFFLEFPKYHGNDILPPPHHSNCACQKTLQDWLLDSRYSIDIAQWKKDFLNNHISTTEPALAELLLKGTGSKNKKDSSPARLLAVSRRNLQYDFQRLCEQGWLTLNPESSRGIFTTTSKSSTRYQKVDSLPILNHHSSLKVTNPAMDIEQMINNDLVEFFQDFGQQIQGQQRFFLDIDYIIHRKLSVKIEEFREILKKVWQQSPIPPCYLNYFSARQYQDKDSSKTYLVFPVCLYYSQRVPYLFAFGETPERHLGFDWYDFRLDRIQQLTPISWDNEAILSYLDSFVKQKKAHNAFEQDLLYSSTSKTLVSLRDYLEKKCQTLSPENIHALKQEAWGFDFFRPIEVMILRFDSYFHARYIEGTERDKFFTKIPFSHVKSLINLAYQNNPKSQELIQDIQRRKQDIYCRVNYRIGDYNVIMRLRAWGPMVEVLSPPALREQMAEESLKTANLYRRSFTY